VVLYAGIIVLIIVISVGAYLLIYQSMINAYREALISLIAQYNATATLYTSLYKEYLAILRMYLNATIASGIIPTNVPPPPNLNVPQIPISISVTLPTQVSPPISSWPPAPPATT